MNNLPKHHGAVPPEVRGPMQPHRLNRFKAGPVHTFRHKRFSDSVKLEIKPEISTD